MELDEAFVRRIEQPPDHRLQDLFAESVTATKSQLNQWGIEDINDQAIRKLSYTYYYDWTTDDPTFLFLLQDPGGVKRQHTSYIRDFTDNSPVDQIRVYRSLAKTWLAEQHADFSERFFTLFDKLGLIEIDDSWMEYLQDEAFFNDFYMTDVVKYRCDGFTKTQERASVNTFLQHELNEIDPDIVFTFGGKAWSAIRECVTVDSVGDPVMNEDKIQDVHGHLFQVNQDTYVLPLAHMSGQIWWRFPPEDYIERLQTGLEHGIDVR